jgi:uncharacterized LabA/DUF88 family protein
MRLRTILFLDYQNVYHNARWTFHRPNESARLGNIHPMKLGRLLAARYPDRDLIDVRVYTGQPDGTKDPAGYQASTRRVEGWKRAGATVVTRPLRYPRGWPNFPAEEKGVDVALALDFYGMAVRRQYDVGILMSTDTDPRPALEHVMSNGDARCEVAAWGSLGSRRRPRLSIPGKSVWCHWISYDEYKLVMDTTKYSRS